MCLTGLYGLLSLCLGFDFVGKWGFGDLCDGLMIEFGRWDFGRLVKWGLRESSCEYWVWVGFGFGFVFFGGELTNYWELQEELMMMVMMLTMVWWWSWLGLLLVLVLQVLLMGLMSNGDDSDKNETLIEQQHGFVTNTMCNVYYI